jgi:hypothetical protein
MRTAVARLMITAAMLLGAHPVRTAPPENADPALAPWFNSLRAPFTNALCCSIADCRPTDSRISGDHYEAFVGGQWRSVPPDRVLQRTDNPTGRAVVCWTPSTGIMCFIRGPES